MEGLYDRLSPENYQVLANHLRSCAECAEEYAEMARTLQIMERRTRPEPDPSFWDNYWTNMSAELSERGKSRPIPKVWMMSIVSFLNRTPRWALQSAAACAILFIGMYLGKAFFSSTVYVDQRSHSPKVLDPASREHSELLTRAHNYVERSKRIVLAIMNFDPEKEDAFALDLPYKQQISRNLIQEASYLKDRLSVSHHSRLRTLVAELERVLLQLANLESEHDLDSIQLIKSGVEWQGILLKIHLSDMREAKTGFRSDPFLKRGQNFGSL